MKKSDGRTKKMKSKWSMDKNWNIAGSGHFFHISDLKFLHFRIEKDNTYTLTMLIGTHLTGMLFGDDKKSAIGTAKFLEDCKKSYQVACKEHEKLYHDNMGKVLSIQEKMIESCDKNHK